MRTPLSRLVCLTLVLALLAAVGASHGEAANKKGVVAPAITISDGINGVTKKTKISDYKGSVVLFVIWLPVCPHCKKFMPTVPALQKKYGEKGLKVLTVTHGKKDYTRKYLAGKKWNFGVGFDYTGRTAKAYGMKGMPGVYLVGKDGRLRTYKGTLDAAIAEECAAK